MDLGQWCALLETAVGASHDAVVITDAELTPPGPHIVYVNDAFTRLTGYSGPEVVGQSPRLLQGPATEPDMLARLRAALEAGEGFTGETWNYRKDGTAYRVEWRITPVALEGDAPDHLVAVQRDVTDLQRARAAHEDARQSLAESEAHYRALVEGGSDFIQRFLPDTTILFANQALAELLGTSPEALVGRVWLDQLDPDQRAWAREYLAAFTPDDPIGHFESSFRLASGERRWVRWTDHAFFDDAGRVTHFQSMGLDITERKFHEARARNRENRLRALIETMVDGVIVIDGGGVIQDFNPAAETIFGYWAQEMVGVNVKYLMPEPHQSAHDGYLRHYQETGERRIIGYGREVEGLRRDGTTFPMELSVSETEIDGEVMFTGIVRDISRRKEVEQAVELHKERLRRGQEFANIGTWEWTIPTGELYWSERIAPLFGYPEGELATSYDNFLAAIHPDDRQAVVDAIDASIHDGAPYDIEHRVVWPDGTVRWLLERGAVLCDDHGEAYQMIGVVQDIDDRKRTELALAEREDALREAQQLAHIGNWKVDLQSGEVFWSDEVYRILGYPPGAFAPGVETFYTAVHADDRPRLQASEANARRGGRLDVVHRVVRPDGDVRHVHELGVAEQDAEGRTLRLLGTVQDITEQVEVEERLVLFQKIFEASDQAIGVTDGDGHFVYANAAHETLTGYAQPELLGRHFSELVAGDGERAYPQEILTALRQTGHWSDLLPIRRKDGSRFTSASNIGVITDDQGRFQNLFNLFSDFSQELARRDELSQAKEEAERANQAKSEFLSSMSHELRTPMNAIIGFAQLMQYDHDLPADHGDNVHEILKAGQHLLDLINEVLDLAKVEAGRMEFSLEPVAVEALVDDVLPMVQTLANKFGVTIERDAMGGASVRADRVRLKQVLLNLITNAIKYNSHERWVRLHLQPQGADSLSIGVSDTGPGIPAERQKELFEPFNRLEAEHSDTEGTGIGLSFSRQVVESMEGRLELDSEVGRGSTFWVTLPAEAPPRLEPEQAPTAGAAGTSATTAPPGASQGTVLYIEDNPANLKLVGQILEPFPAVAMVSAHNPETGIELALSHSPDLILLDINLPGLDGYEVLEILREEAALAEVPVVAITANAMAHDIERGRRAGFDDYLTKPIDVSRLHEVVTTHLQASQPTRGGQA